MGAPIKVRGTGNYGVETATIQRILRKVAEDSSMDPEHRASLIAALNTAVGLFNEDTASAVMSQSKPASKPSRKHGNRHASAMAK